VKQRFGARFQDAEKSGRFFSHLLLQALNSIVSNTKFSLYLLQKGEKIIFSIAQTVATFKGTFLGCG